MIKLALIFCNVLLSCMLCVSVWRVCFGDSNESGGLEVGKKSRTKSSTVQKAAETAELPPVKTVQEASRVITEKNVFDSARCSAATSGRGMRGGGGTTYSLVGTYHVGALQGCIVLSRGGMRGPNAQTQQQQFFRVGETLPNGYTLTSVEADKAILSRGSGKMTLELAQASENNTARGSGNGNRGNRGNSNNPIQQVVQLMQQSVGMQQMQSMNMMRMMQQQNRNNGNNGNNRNAGQQNRGSTNSRNRSR